MADLGSFNASEVEPNVDFVPLPEGKYEAIISETEMKPTASGNGEYLKLTLTVVGGTYDGRSLFDNLNLKNPSEMAVKIARGQLSSICRAVNVLTPRDSSELHNLPLIVRVVQEKYEDRMVNKVKGYYKVEREDAPALSQVPPAGGPPKAKPAAAPWGKK
jgi:hypothetical protein